MKIDRIMSIACALFFVFAVPALAMSGQPPEPPSWASRHFWQILIFSLLCVTSFVHLEDGSAFGTAFYLIAALFYLVYAWLHS